MDDGSSESGKVREYECIDIYDYGEVDQERASASVTEEHQDFVCKDLGQYTFVLGENKGK